MYYLMQLYELLILYVLDAKIHKYCTNSNFPPQMHVTGAYATTAAGEALSPSRKITSGSRLSGWLGCQLPVLVDMAAPLIKRTWTASMLFVLAGRWMIRS